MKKVLFLIIIFAGLVACKSKKPEEIPPVFNVMLSPNPFQEALSIRIENKSDEIASIRVFDPNNKTVFKESIASGESNYLVNLAQYPNGIYKVVFSTSQNNYSKSVVKIK